MDFLIARLILVLAFYYPVTEHGNVSLQDSMERSGHFLFLAFEGFEKAYFDYFLLITIYFFNQYLPPMLEILTTPHSY